MKAVILAGGLGTRIMEESNTKPKPMIEIGGYPILWHIMKIYASFGINDFIICLGYKGFEIKKYFESYYLRHSDVTFDLKNNKISYLNGNQEPWTVTLIDTGEHTMTGGRLKRIAPLLGEEDFCFTYGDAVSDISIGDLIKFHRQHGKLATVSAVRPIGRFGHLNLDGNTIIDFKEKPPLESGYINGGFFVLSPQVISYIKNDDTIWEKEPLDQLVKNNDIEAYQHDGFWHCMDTLSDMKKLEEIWRSSAPWKRW